MKEKEGKGRRQRVAWTRRRGVEKGREVEKGRKGKEGREGK